MLALNSRQLRSPIWGPVTVFLILVACLSLLGCESFRPHDEARLKTAEQAVGEAAALMAGGGAVFGPMEDNLDKVKETQTTLRKLTNDHEFEALKLLVPGLSPNDIGEKLLEAMQGRQETFESIAAAESAAAGSVNDALDRHSLISAAIKGAIDKDLMKLQEDLAAAQAKNETAKVDRLKKQIMALTELSTSEKADAKRSLEQTLNRTNTWLDWIEQGLQRFNKAQALIETAGRKAPNAMLDNALVGISEHAETSASVLGRLVEDAQKALDGVEKDEPVKAAKQLLKAAIEQTAMAEQERLIEFRRHLGEVKRLGDRHRVRDKVSVCNLYITALGNMYFVVNDPVVKEGLATVTNELSASGRYNTVNGRSCLRQLNVGDTDAVLQAQWVGDRLDSYVATVLNTNQVSEEGRSASQFVGSLGILLFHDRQMFEDTRLELAREQHRHSIRLSRINAGQRADIVHQLAQGLAIYYQGGVKPEQIAQLFLLATQVGGIFFIGSQF